MRLWKGVERRGRKRHSTTLAHATPSPTSIRIYWSGKVLVGHMETKMRSRMDVEGERVRD